MDFNKMLFALGRQNGEYTSRQLQKALMVQNACLLRIANSSLSASDAIREVLEMYAKVDRAFAKADEWKLNNPYD